MRRALLGWVGLGSLGLVAFAACLPEVTVDDSLGSDTLSLQGGSAGTAGSAGKGPSSAGAGGVAGADSSSAGTGGAAGTEGDAMPPSTAMGGAGGADGDTPANSSGAGGAAGTAGAPAAGAGGMSAAAGAGGATGDVCPAGLTRELACNAYCALYTEACGNFPLAYDYQGPADCSLYCYDSDWEIGTISQPDSIMCRCNHSNLALLRGQTPHCYHAARVPSMTGGCEIPPP